MTTKIKASVLHGIKDLRLATVDIQSPNKDELQVSIRSTGICGSDLHYYSHFRLGDILIREPMTLGHESAGIVVAVGSDLQNVWRVGDKTALEVGIPCGKETCELCKGTKGERYNVCQGMRFRSSAKSYPHLPGTLQEIVNHPARLCHRLPQDMDNSLSAGALAEPLAVAVHANKRARLEPGKTIMVFGAGPVGLLVSAIAKISGAKEVVIADIDKARLAFATEKGFAHKSYTIEKQAQRPKDVNEALDIAKGIPLKMTEHGLPAAYDAVFECTGVEACLQTAIYCTKPAGKIMLIGMGTPIQTIPISAAAHREVDLIGVFRYTSESYKRAIEILSEKIDGYPDFMSLVTHRFKGFEGIQKAFDTAGRTTDENGKLVLKVMIDFDDV